VFLGVGLWRPDSTALAAIRDRISVKQAEWLRARDDKSFKQHFHLRGFDKDHPLIEDIKRKDFIAAKNMELDEATQPRFQQKVETAFKTGIPLMQFLCKAVGVPY
jgi:uncharacterized protein (TIGR02453 family)